MSDIITVVANFLKKYNLQNKTIIVGFSGGYDSMCLLDVLDKIHNTQDFIDMKVIAAHFNHNWRGEEALQEQEVCRIFATSKGMDFYTKTAPNNLKKTENDARIARYDFFEEALDEYDASAVLTAHNFDDNAETLLYRFIKGTGIVGLKGISAHRDIYYRPLLTVKRSEILDYCNIYNLTPNNDSSNSNVAYKRNYLRLNILPAMAKINPNVKEAINTLAIIANSDNDIIEEFLAPLRKKIFTRDGSTIDSEQYNLCSRPVKLRLLHEFIQTLDLDYDYKKIIEIYDFIEAHISQRNGTTMSLATAMWLYADEKIIEIIPRKKSSILSQKHYEIDIPKNGEYEIAHNIFKINKYLDKELFNFPGATSRFVYLDLSHVKFPLVLRTRKEGDVISPFGMSGTMKLKKFLNSKGVPRHERDTVLLLCSENEVLWAVGVGISNKVAVKEKPTHVLELI